MRLRVWLAALGSTFALTGGAFAGPPRPTAPGDQDIVATFGPDVRVVREPLGKSVRALYGLKVPTAGATPTARAAAFVEASRAALGLGHSDTTTFTAAETQPLPTGGHVVRFEQSWRGVPVESRSLAVKLDAAGQVVSLNSDIVPLSLSRPAATITPDAAKAIVAATYEVAMIGAPRERVLASTAHHARLALRVPVAVIPLQAHFFVWLDAETGAVLREAPAGHDNPMRHLPKKGGAR